MDNQEAAVSPYLTMRKVLSYWKTQCNGSLFSHLLFWFCTAPAVAVNRFVVWWWIRPLLKLFFCLQWVVPPFSPVVTVNEKSPGSRAQMLGKVYYLLLGSAGLQLVWVRAGTKICWLLSHFCQGFWSKHSTTDGILRSLKNYCENEEKNEIPEEPCSFLKDSES